MLRRLTTLAPKVAAKAPAMSTRFFSAEAKRSFRVLGIQQIALGGLDKNELSKFWVDIMGLNKVLTFESAKENVNEDVLSIGTGPLAVEVDLMQPLDATKSPKVHDPALNHFGLWIDNLEACVSELTSKGVRFTPGGIRKGASGHNVCFIHPKGNAAAGFPIGAGGVLVELVQAPQDVIEALGKQ
jgi:lactoylglutathione lyase